MWEGVPWAIGGEAQHDADVVRVAAYVATAGREGVVGPGDLAVKSTTVASSNVEVATGACSIISRSSSSPFEAYAGRMKTVDTASIAPTTSGGGRSDLIVARVENPFATGESWAFPSTRATGPYIFTRVISNVPPGTTRVQAIRPGDSAITLARIDLPPSTSAVTQEMITDLRQMLTPRQERKVIVASPAAQYDITNPSLVTWTNIAPTVAVPAWATTCQMIVHIAGLGRSPSSTRGQIRALLGALPTTATSYQLEAGSGAELVAVTLAGALNVTSIAGTSKTLTLEANRSSGALGILRAFTTSVVAFDLQFSERLS